jgi:hypothetical protein
MIRIGSGEPSIWRPLPSDTYMRVLPFLLLLGASRLWAAADPAITQVKAVYLMPMGKGLDQYLATQLTKDRVFDVVTDPELADAVLTDRIGPAFEQAFLALYPPPPPPAPPPAAAKPDTAAEKPAAEKSIGESLSDRPDLPPRVSTFARGRGSVYLIDRKTKRVLWSDYRPPRSSRPDEVNRAADKLVDRLEDDLERLRNPQKQRGAAAQ